MMVVRYFQHLKASPARYQLLQIIAVMILIVLGIMSASVWVLYNTAVQGERARLSEAAQSQARLIEAIAHFNQQDSQTKGPEHAFDVTLTQVTDAHEKYKGFGKTGEFTLAQRQYDNIVFLMRHRHYDLSAPKPIPWESPLSEPMHRALKGESGVMIGTDYRGVQVLAAYEPVAIFDAGIVAKIDMAEIREPFIKASALTFLGALIILFWGVILLRRISQPGIALEKTLKDLEESEARFRSLVEGSIQGVLIHQDFKILFANQAIANILGYDNPADLLALNSLLDLFPPAERADVIRNKDARMQGKDAPDFYEFECLRKDNSLIWVEIRLSVVEWRGQRVIQGAYIDITQRKSAEAERELAFQRLQETDQLYRTILDNAPAPITLKDPEGRYLFVNKIFADRNHMSPGDVVGKNVTKFWPSKKASEILANDQIIMDTGVAIEITTESLGLDGKPVYLQGNKFPVFNTNGDITAIGAVYSDITQQREAEAKTQYSQAQLQSIINNFPGEIILKDVQGRFVLINATFLRQRNQTQESMIGKTIHDIAPKDHADQIVARDQQVMEHGTVLTGERDILLPDGSSVPVLWTKFPVYQTDGALMGIGVISVNNTDLRKALNEAREANKSKQDFLANMSHELRTPLNAIMGFSEVMELQILGPLENDRYLSYAHDISTSAQHLLELINDILDISKIEAGKHELVYTDVDLAKVVASSVHVLQGQIDQKQHRFDFHIDAAVPNIFADASAIRQILINILSNAVKFTPENGEIQLEITTHKNRSEDRPYVCILVSDTGIGIPEDDIEKIVTPFTQSGNIDFAGEGGTGLGLSIVDSLVRLHGGTLDIRSRLNEGTRISITLPCSPADIALDTGQSEA